MKNAIGSTIGSDINIKNIIRGIIIKKIKGKLYFDSHYIIRILIEKHSDEYLVFAAANLPKRKRKQTEFVHSKIAKIIDSFASSSTRLLLRVSGESISHNIHGNSSHCAIWRKVARRRVTTRKSASKKMSRAPLRVRQ